MTDTVMSPVKKTERINEIDIIRGIALLGILIVNMHFFKSPVMAEHSPSDYPFGLDQATSWIINLFFAGKFYAIFSFLFGLGFYIFMERTLAKGINLVPLYRRRLLALLAFGAIHLFILWSGDILFAYALAGFLLMLFREKSLDQLKKWIIGLFLTATILLAMFGLFNGMAEYFVADKAILFMEELVEKSYIIYTTGSFSSILIFRLAYEIPYVFISFLLWIPMVMSFFLCGLYMGKLKVFKDIAGHIHFFKKICFIGLPIGFVILWILVLLESGIWAVHPIIKSTLMPSANFAASIFLFSGYISIIILALRKDIIKKIMSPIASVGRMALTNYLSQTIICMVIFYGFGFGWFGQISLTRGVLLTIIIYAVQVILSHLWLKIFQYGPLEWLWRILTYKQVQPLLKGKK